MCILEPIRVKKGILRQLLGRPLAAVAMVVILLSALVAVCAYVLAPDNTPDSNTMVIELGARPPGFTCQLLKVPKAKAPEPVGTLEGWLHGVPSRYRLVPFTANRVAADTIYIQHYIDEGLSDVMRFGFKELIPGGVGMSTPAEQQRYIETNSIEHRTFRLGTDRYGRDILSRLITGSRVSLSVGFVAVLLSLTIGIVLGSAAGYFGGRVDDTVMWLINILWAIPTLLLVFALTLTIGKGFWEIFVAIGLTMWVGAARLIRGQVMVLREMDYVTAAKTLGVPDMRIIVRHILPNIAGPLMVIAASNFAAAILTEAGLSFLGIGVQPPQPSWGLMIKEHYNFLLTNKPFPALIPGIAIMLLVYSFNILGNALRDILDVKG